MSTFRTAYVYVRNSFAGELSENDDGYSFSYDKIYLNSNGIKAALKNFSAQILCLKLR